MAYYASSYDLVQVDPVHGYVGEEVAVLVAVRGEAISLVVPEEGMEYVNALVPSLPDAHRYQDSISVTKININT